MIPDGLLALGWDPSLATAVARSGRPDRRAARVVAEERGAYLVHDGTATRPAVISGRLRHDAEEDPLAYPGVGDWVQIGLGGPAPIHAVLPRRTALVRHGPADRSAPAQLIAANVDVVFVVTSLNAELNLRRLERYLAVAWESGATPVVVLSKADLDSSTVDHASAVREIAIGVDVIETSVVDGTGLDRVRGWLAPGRTVVFVGSSGVGKSTLVNALAGGEVLATAAVRDDDARGRHTTTRRQLLPLADGLVIDTPGMRELGLLDGEGLAAAFADVDVAAAGCRFRDCAHETEPGCAVRAALEAGELDGDRFRAYRKLEREARRAELATDAIGRRAERRRWTTMAREVDRHMQAKYGREA